MLAILPIDSGRYGTKEMMEIFSEQKKVDYQLEIEGAAAISQSEIKIIPKQLEEKSSKLQHQERSLQKESNS